MNIDVLLKVEYNYKSVKKYSLRTFQGENMYSVGQKICLWDVKYDDSTNSVRVTREVLVTITETKTGTLGEFSGEPVSSQSLRGITEDGRQFEKHWDSWPESQMNDFSTSWSFQEEADGAFWVPIEAVHAYNNVSRARKDNPGLMLLDADGRFVVPKGDKVVYCRKHDRYSYENEKREACFFCFAEQNRSSGVPTASA